MTATVRMWLLCAFHCCCCLLLPAASPDVSLKEDVTDLQAGSAEDVNTAGEKRSQTSGCQLWVLSVSSHMCGQSACQGQTGGQHKLSALSTASSLTAMPCLTHE